MIRSGRAAKSKILSKSIRLKGRIKRMTVPDLLKPSSLHPFKNALKKAKLGNKHAQI